MAAEQYFIIQDNNEWKISFKDTYYGPYDSERDAIEAAIDAAFVMGGVGIDAQVLVQDAEHQHRTEWAYTQDFTAIIR